MKNQSKWPAPPKNSDGSSKPWTVVTEEFNSAAEIGIYQRFANNNQFELKRRENDFRAGHLVGFYDDSCDSFHVQRCFEDGDKETVYQPSNTAAPIDYKDILDLMMVWQRSADANASCRNERGKPVAKANYPGTEDINHIIYNGAWSP